ncbi:MAG: AMP-binding protein [Paracoccaceae bacterium]|nr:AMP-binding protein [Paracoccaceae bacterium]
MSENKNLFFQLTKNLNNKKDPFISNRDGTVFSYEDMIKLSGCYANTLSNLGIQKNDRVLVQTEKQIECIWLYLACLRVGAIYVTINPDYTISETEFFVKDSKPKLFIRSHFSKNFEINNRGKVLDGTIIKHLQNTSANSLSVIASSEACEFKTSYCTNDDIAAILYTSGTTGRSKGAMISHKNLFSNAKTLSHIWHINANDILLHILPIYHTHGLFVAFNSIIYSGASVLFYKNFIVNDVINALAFTTILMGVPTHYIRLIAEKKFTKQSAKNIRLFISGSAPLSSEVHTKFKKITNLAILERYGMTETNMITSNPYDGERRSGTVGFPLPDVSVRIRNLENGRIINNGKVGIIEVKGPNVFRGYWQMDERNEVDFQSDGFFITGDLGFFDSAGYLNISGRNKDLIISGGLNIYPAEVERIIDALQEVNESAVIGLPHPDFGEAVTAIITLGDQHTTLNEQDLRNHIRDKLAGFKVPLKIKVKDSLPKNAMGKIQKNLLRTEFKDLYSNKA